MTYIVGFGQPGLNTIIADTRVSWRDDTGVLKGQDTALKIGLLFPGCIYGACGSPLATEVFIRSFKESMYDVTDTVLGFWQRFERFTASYPFPAQQFQLLLSHRGHGAPRFALLDSTTGINLLSGLHGSYLLAYGSGCAVLNTPLKEDLTPKLDRFHDFLLSTMKFPHGLIHHQLPYYVCLWLNERSLTYEKSQWKLEHHGVGGVFHFLWQDANMEAAQMPTVYIFSMIDRASRAVRSWIYRTATVQGGLYLEASDLNTERPTRDVFFNDAARHDLEAHFTRVDFPKLIEKELAALPFYYFCGFGFVNPSDRQKLFGFFSPSPTGGKREDIIDSSEKPTPKLTPFVMNMIYDNFGLITLDAIY